MSQRGLRAKGHRPSRDWAATGKQRQFCESVPVLHASGVPCMALVVDHLCRVRCAARRTGMGKRVLTRATLSSGMV